MKTEKSVSTRCKKEHTDKVLDVFMDRKGFGWWYEPIESSCKREIRKELATTLQEIIKKEVELALQQSVDFKASKDIEEHS